MQKGKLSDAGAEVSDALKDFEQSEKQQEQKSIQETSSKDALDAVLNAQSKDDPQSEIPGDASSTSKAHDSASPTTTGKGDEAKRNMNTAFMFNRKRMICKIGDKDRDMGECPKDPNENLSSGCNCWEFRETGAMSSDPIAAALSWFQQKMAKSHLPQSVAFGISNTGAPCRQPTKEKCVIITLDCGATLYKNDNHVMIYPINQKDNEYEFTFKMQTVKFVDQKDALEIKAPVSVIYSNIDQLDKCRRKRDLQEGTAS